MALITNFQDAGDGKVVSKSSSKRKYRVGEDADFIDYIETEVSESRVWVGLTFAAADAQVSLNVQPNETGAQYAWSLSEDNREVGSYSVERTYTRTTTEVAGSTPAPTMTAPSFSPGGRASVGDYLDGGPSDLSLTITNNVAGSSLFYRIEWSTNETAPNVAVGATWPYSRFATTFANGDFTETTGNVTVALARSTTSQNVVRLSNSTVVAADGSGLRIGTVYKVTAYCVKTQLTGTFSSPTTTRYFHLKNLLPGQS